MILMIEYVKQERKVDKYFTLIGHPLGFSRLWNKSLKNSLLSPLTASSKVSKTNCGVFSFLRPPGICEPPQKHSGNLQ